MRYESHNYFHHVQRQFCLHFDESYDAKRGEMRDAGGTVIRTEGHVSHSVQTSVELATCNRLSLYSYQALVGRMWRVKVGEGIRHRLWLRDELQHEVFDVVGVAGEFQIPSLKECIEHDAKSATFCPRCGATLRVWSDYDFTGTETELRAEHGDGGVCEQCIEETNRE